MLFKQLMTLCTILCVFLRGMGLIFLCATVILSPSPPWQGCLGMQVGEVRSIDMPSSEGYGKDGYPGWGIPPNARLVFEIEVRASRTSAGPLKSVIDELCAFAKDKKVVLR